MKYLYILFVLLSFLIFISCDDLFPDPPPPTLPEITTEAKGTFGCYINGELWLPKGGGGNLGGYNPLAKYTEFNGNLSLTTRFNDDGTWHEKKLVQSVLSFTFYCKRKIVKEVFLTQNKRC